MKKVFGNFVDVSKDEMFERQASDEKFPKIPLIVDIILTSGKRNDT